MLFEYLLQMVVPTVFKNKQKLLENFSLLWSWLGTQASLWEACLWSPCCVLGGGLMTRTWGVGTHVETCVYITSTLLPNFYSQRAQTHYHCKIEHPSPTVGIRTHKEHL